MSWAASRGSLACLLVSISWTGSASAAEIEVSGSVEAASATGAYLCTFEIFDLFAFQNLDDGTATATLHSGFTSLSGVAPANVTLSFGDLELKSVTTTAATATEYYGNTDATGPIFDLYVNSTKVGEGSDFSMAITSTVNGCVATGVGVVTLTGVTGSAFYNDLQALTGNTGMLRITIHTFTSAGLTDPTWFSFTATIATMSEDPIFSDGFESGDTTMWSESGPI